MNLRICLMTLLTMVSLIVFAQYPTTKTINGTKVVIMTVPQAEQIDQKFTKLSDSIKLINLSLFQNRENLDLTSQKLIRTNKSLLETKDSLNKSLMANNFYLKEIEKYKKMEFEDKKVQQTVVIGVVSALAVWLTIFITGISQ